MPIKEKISALNKYLSLPEKYPAEFIKGEIVMSPSPSVKHQEIAGEIFVLLKRVSGGKGKVFYELDVHFDEDNVVRPDIIYVSDESKIKDNWIEGAPDLVVEVLSGSTATVELIDKKELYEKFGVKEYWVIDIENSMVYVFKNEGGRFVLSCRGKVCLSEILKSFSWGSDEKK